MKQIRVMMGMPITVEVLDASVTAEALARVFSYFAYVDAKFSTYKETSEISRINAGKLAVRHASRDMRLIFKLAEQTKRETDGYFDIEHGGIMDPSGIVKGWAIQNAAELLRQAGFENFYVDAGGDIQVVGKNAAQQEWRVGIRNPFNIHEVVKVIAVSDCGVATSGTSIRGKHLYNPKGNNDLMNHIVSLTVVGPNVYEADRMATAAFAMGQAGLLFIDQLPGFEGYRIDEHGHATMTRGFAAYADRAQVLPTSA